jgi:hypothetical protein
MGILVIFGNLVYFSPLWCIVPRKIWQPWFDLGIPVKPAALRSLQSTVCRNGGTSLLFCPMQINSFSPGNNFFFGTVT